LRSCSAKRSRSPDSPMLRPRSSICSHSQATCSERHSRRFESRGSLLSARKWTRAPAGTSCHAFSRVSVTVSWPRTLARAPSKAVVALSPQFVAEPAAHGRAEPCLRPPDHIMREAALHASLEHVLSRQSTKLEVGGYPRCMRDDLVVEQRHPDLGGGCHAHL